MLTATGTTAKLSKESSKAGGAAIDSIMDVEGDLALLKMIQQGTTGSNVNR